MLVCRYADGGRRGYGRVDHDHVVPVEYDPDAGRWVPRPGPARPLGEVRVLAPAEPTKIVCVALNYRAEGAAGTGRPADSASMAVVLKPPSSLVGPWAPVSHPGRSWVLKHEAELAVVIGTRCKRVSPARAEAVVAGFTCANDITAYARDGAGPGGHPVWAKHFDGCTPLGPWLATDLDAADAEITCRVDGELRQRGSTRDLLTPVHDVVALVSEHMTLLPGDVILTGTPGGSGPLPAGGRVEVAIGGVGTLCNTIGEPSGAAGETGAAGSEREGRPTP
ncbi:fumarylacetoacetate hydrolase family protein [Actinomadura litoris]|uniref:fumarylacetoacetate hydrolase family protein n=1 Tax=Actinomadura litoris TaxID=2678616 RepID=UPI001FA72196|nr:fumarylacetoacetate hydrolase family protein [Actinomadura litoris]